MDKFEEDIRIMQKALEEKHEPKFREEIANIAERLIELHKINYIKINHSVLEYVLAAYLTSKGFKTDVEHPLENDLVADIVAWKGKRSMIVEVETGFTSPENAIDPQSYLTARAISKIARYSLYADMFSLATPAHNILQIPSALLKPAKNRRPKDVALLKKLCDKYYATPTVALEKLANMKLHSIYVINVDTLEVKRLTPKSYLTKFRNLCPDQEQIKKYLRAGLRSRVA